MDSRTTIALRVHIPVACFRRPYAREYWESFPLPPPSTVFGMLLSMVGEEDRLQHISARVALGRLSESPVSRVLRTFYRWKEKEITSDKNRSPDWQELLTDVRIAVWVTDGDHEPAGKGPGTLRKRLEEAVERPGTTERFGGLCLGESTHLVDGVWLLSERPLDEQGGERLEVLTPSDSGDLILPVWPDHVGSSGTKWGNYRLEPRSGPIGIDLDDFTAIEPPP